MIKLSNVFIIQKLANGQPGETQEVMVPHGDFDGEDLYGHLEMIRQHGNALAGDVIEFQDENWLICTPYQRSGDEDVSGRYHRFSNAEYIAYLSCSQEERQFIVATELYPDSLPHEECDLGISG